MLSQRAARLYRFHTRGGRLRATGGTTMDVLVPVLVQLISGAAGGNVLGQLVRRASLGRLGNSIFGAIGGLAGTFGASQVPGLDSLVGTADGLDPGALAGQGAVGLLSGALLTAIAGAIKSAMAKH